MIKNIVFGQLRHFFTAGGGFFIGWLIAHGATPEQATVVGSAVMVLAGMAWSAFEKTTTIKPPGSGNP